MSMFSPKDGDTPMLRLGPVVRKPVAETPLGTEVATGTPGIYQAPNGQLFTRFPENERARSQAMHNVHDSLYGYVSSETYTFAGPQVALQNLPKRRIINIGDSYTGQEYEDGLVAVSPWAHIMYDQFTGIRTRVS